LVKAFEKILFEPENEGDDQKEEEEKESDFVQWIWFCHLRIFGWIHMLPFRHPGMDLVEGLILLNHKRLVLINFEKKNILFSKGYFDCN
jgi:hypothetical protein